MRVTLSARLIFHDWFRSVAESRPLSISEDLPYRYPTETCIDRGATFLVSLRTKHKTVILDGFSSKSEQVCYQIQAANSTVSLQLFIFRYLSALRALHFTEFINMDYHVGRSPSE